MRRRGRWIAVIAAGIVLLPALMVFDIHRRAAATLERHRSEVEARWVELRGRSAERPVVLGEPEEGNAWDLYRQGEAGLQKMTSDEKEAIPEIDATWDVERKPDDPAIAAIYRKYEADMDLLRRGMRRRVVDPAYELSPELDHPVGPFFAAGGFLRGAVGLHHRQGDDRKAVEAGLAGIVLGQDFGRRSFLLGALVQVVHEDRTLEGLREILAGHSLDRDALAETASRLDRLMSARPSWLEALDWEDVYTRKNLLDYPSWEKAFPMSGDPPRPGWRQCYSDRVMRAQALNAFSDWLSLIRRTRGRPFREESRLLDEAAAFAESSGNPLARDFLSSLTGVAAKERKAVLGYRLCRLAVALAWFEAERGRPPSSLAQLVPRHIGGVPECPMTGTPFRYVPGKVWSVGKDGKDDGGRIDETRGYDPEHEGADAVWFVKRR